MVSRTDIVDEQIDAYVHGDIDRFVATYADDAICSEIPSGRIIAQNKDDIRRIWGAMFVNSPRDCQITQRIIQDDFIIDLEHITIEKTGQVIDAVAIYMVGPTQIERVWFLARPPKADA